MFEKDLLEVKNIEDLRKIEEKIQLAAADEIRYNKRTFDRREEFSEKLHHYFDIVSVLDFEIFKNGGKPIAQEKVAQVIFKMHTKDLSKGNKARSQRLLDAGKFFPTHQIPNDLKKELPLYKKYSDIDISILSGRER